MITIFTDGSSRGNPGPGGWGTVMSDGAKVKELGGREERTTNNRMELKAALEGLRAVKGVEDIVIYTDSSYLLNGITKWLKGWEANGWKTKTKSPVLNADIWQDLSEVVKGKKIAWRLIPGHAAIPGNERCDEIATAFADESLPRLYEGPVNTYSADLSMLEADMQKKKKSSSVAKAYSYISEVDGMVMVHRSWPECERRVKGKKARFKKAYSKEEEEWLVDEWTYKG